MAGTAGMDVAVEDLTVDFPQRGVRAVDRVTVSIAGGEQVALVGPSGAGKTTLLRALLGAVPVTGRLRVGGWDPGGSAGAAARVRRAAGFVRQGEDLVPGLSARLNALMGTASGWRPRDWAAVCAGRVPAGHGTHLAALAAELDVEACLPARAAELSGGQRKRIALIRALLPRPRLLLADEPTNGLDPVTADIAVAALRAAEGATLIAATHDLAVARRFPRIIALRAGRLVYDGPRLDDTAAAAIYGDGIDELGGPG
jgi:ABC-type phosphate/phosphonate transport system ATPase subunit